MKKVLCACWIYFIANTIIGQTIINPGFETIAFDKDWTVNVTSDTRIHSDSLQFKEGARSIRISGHSTGWFRQPIPYEHRGKAPERLRIKAYIKTSLTSGYTKLFARVVDQDNNIARYDVMGTSRVTGNTDWTEYYIDIITDRSAKEIRIGGYFDGAGEAYFDNFWITNVTSVKGSNSQAIQEFTRKYLEIFRDNALYKDSVDFDTIEQQVYELTNTASTINDCFPVLTYAISKLKDGHSFIMPGEDVKNWQSDDEKNQVYASYKLIDQVGYIYVPQFMSDNKKITDAFADSLQRVIKHLDKTKLKGWVIDLRDNLGGNCWPMLAGIGPILGDGIHGYFYSRSGKKVPWSYVKGASWEGDSIRTAAHSPYELKNQKRPVAILMNQFTASSAEVLAVSFMGLPNARSFGEPSFGATTTNEEFKLDDGSMLFLCSGVYMNRNEKKFGGKLIPDQLVEETSEGKSERKTDGKADKPLEEAIKWIQARK